MADNGYRNALIVGVGSDCPPHSREPSASKDKASPRRAGGPPILPPWLRTPAPRCLPVTRRTMVKSPRYFLILRMSSADPKLLSTMPATAPAARRHARSGRGQRSLAVTAFGMRLGRAGSGQTHGAAGAWRDLIHRRFGASVKGYAQSAPFAMGKFALRGLAQSMARELAPLGIHVGHVVVDGGIRSQSRPVPSDRPDSLLDPDAIAQTYLDLLRQPRSAWAWEIELRPWIEKF